MRVKSVINLGVALGCGVVASAGISKVVVDKRAAPTEEMVEIYVASKAMEAGFKMAETVLKKEAWPKSKLPPGAITSLKDLEGKFAKQPLFEGEPLIDKKLMNSNESAAVAIPEGYRIFDIPVDANMGYIKPGDRVDIFGYFDKKAGKLADSASMQVMQNVAVQMVDGIATRNPDEPMKSGTKTMQLLIHDSQYEALNLASHLAEGKLKLALRPSDGTGQSTTPDTGEAFLEWIKKSQAAREEQDAKRGGNSGLESTDGASGPEQFMVILSPNGQLIYAVPPGGGLPQLIAGDEKAGFTGASKAMPGLGGATGGSLQPGGFDPNYPKDQSDPFVEKDENDVSKGQILPEIDG